MINVFVRKICHYLFNPRNLYVRFALIKLESEKELFSDEEYLKKYFRIVMGYELNLDNPKTFNEKMQWLKLYNRQSIYTTMVDKHAVKKFVSDIIGSEFVAEELGCYASPNDIDLSKLPNQFVLKTTHGCGGMIVVHDKTKIDTNMINKILGKSLKDNYYYHCREWPYKNVQPRIIAEELLKDNKFDILPVYKFFCFDGEPFLLQAIKNDKHENETIDYFDMNWTNLHIRQNYPSSRKPLDMPQSFDKMKSICRKLTKGIPFVRCDLFDVNGKVYFSEFTFFSDAGFEKFHPNKWDLLLGEKIAINSIIR